MKRLAIALCLLAPGSVARAQDRGSLGLGVVAGDPTALTLKTFLSRDLALDAGFGFSGDAVLYGGALWHSWNLLPQPRRGRLAAYAGLGPRFELAHRDTEFGLRAMIGTAYWVAAHPIEAFFELGPVFPLERESGVDLDAGIGLRFYFGGGKG